MTINDCTKCRAYSKCYGPRPPDAHAGSPLAVRHPLLEEYRINSVVVEDVTAPVEDDRGVWNVEIKLIQYQEPVRVLAGIGGAAQDEDHPRSRLDRDIANDTLTLNQLANRGNHDPLAPWRR